MKIYLADTIQSKYLGYIYILPVRFCLESYFAIITKKKENLYRELWEEFNEGK